MSAEWDWVADSAGIRVGVVTSRRECTTSTVVTSGRFALLVDPAWDPDELSAIADDLGARGLTVTGFATHAHHDHVMWHPGLGDGPRWASERVALGAAGSRASLIQALGSGFPTELTALVGMLTSVSGARLPWIGAEVQLITHDGHSAGHTALWVPAVRVLIAGDMLSDVELPLLERSTAADYDRGLDLLRAPVGRALVVIPGHGHPAVGRTAAARRWRADKEYLDTIRAGDHSPDPRRDLPGMQQAHRDNVFRVRQAGEVS